MKDRYAIIKEKNTGNIQRIFDAAEPKKSINFPIDVTGDKWYLTALLNDVEGVEGNHLHVQVVDNEGEVVAYETSTCMYPFEVDEIIERLRAVGNKAQEVIILRMVRNVEARLAPLTFTDEEREMLHAKG